jgi:hypothetical protein
MGSRQPANGTITGQTGADSRGQQKHTQHGTVQSAAARESAWWMKLHVVADAWRRVPLQKPVPVASSVVTFSSSWSALFTYSSSQAVHRAHRSSRVSRVAGP